MASDGSPRPPPTPEEVEPVESSPTTTSTAGAAAVGEPPPAAAVEQPDGSFVQELEDGSSKRWTQRADGSWRKPEHRRASRPSGSPLAKAGAEPAGPIVVEEAGDAPAATDADAAAPPVPPVPAAVSSAAVAQPPPASKSPQPQKTDGKHKLQRGWCFHVGPRVSDMGTGWSEGHKLVHEFDTVEDFWCLYHHSHLPSSIDNSDYLLFKKDTKDNPTSYYKGGRWVLSFKEVSGVDDAWLGSVLALIGESFEVCGSEEVVSGVGLSVNRQGGTKVELWITDAGEEEQVLAIGRHFQAAISEYRGLWEKASQLMNFEDFSKRKVVVKLAGPKAAKSTAGIFQ